MKTIVVAATLDTKLEAAKYLAEQIRGQGFRVLLMDLSTRSKGDCPDADITAGQVLETAGHTIEEILGSTDRVFCMEAIQRGAAAILQSMILRKGLDGFAALGGGSGTCMVAGILKQLPVGLPKLLITTILNLDGTAGAFEGVNDTILMNSLVDIAGLNSILKMILREGSGAISGAIRACTPQQPQEERRKRVAISMWGVTTPCVEHLQQLLEGDGYEVFVFHANGIGGNAMEDMAAQGFFDLILDITLPELTMPLAGSPVPPLPDRLRKTSKLPVPRILSVGGLDMVQFPACQIPRDKQERSVYLHNANLAFVRSSCDEMIRFAEEIAGRLKNSQGETLMALPLKGLSLVDQKGGPLYDPQADAVLFETLKKRLPASVAVREYPFAINDREFAEALYALTSEVLER